MEAFNTASTFSIHVLARYKFNSIPAKHYSYMIVSSEKGETFWRTLSGGTYSTHNLTESIAQEEQKNKTWNYLYL